MSVIGPRVILQRAGRRLPPVAALGVISLMGCSPALYALREREAAASFEEARAVDARHLARYELTLSRLYLAKAREVAGEARYAWALDLARRSIDNSVRARALALARAPEVEPRLEQRAP